MSCPGPLYVVPTQYKPWGYFNHRDEFIAFAGLSYCCLFAVTAGALNTSYYEWVSIRGFLFCTVKQIKEFCSPSRIREDASQGPTSMQEKFLLTIAKYRNHLNFLGCGCSTRSESWIRMDWASTGIDLMENTFDWSTWCQPCILVSGAPIFSESLLL